MLHYPNRSKKECCDGSGIADRVGEHRKQIVASISKENANGNQKIAAKRI